MRRMRIEGNSYINDSRKLYNPTQISQDLLNNVTDFWISLVEGKCEIDLIKGFEEYELPVSVGS